MLKFALAKKMKEQDQSEKPQTPIGENNQDQPKAEGEPLTLQEREQLGLALIKKYIGVLRKLKEK